MSKKQPRKTKTQRKLAGWKFLRGFMKGSKYVVAETPAAVMVAVNHKDWFPTVTQTVSVSTGFSMFCITILLSVFLIGKKSETYKKISPFLTAAIYLIIFGVICLFLSSILTDLGWLLLYTGIGMVVAVCEDTLERNAVSKKVEYWNGVLSEAGLNDKENNEKAKKAADVKKAKDEAKAVYQAVE